MPNLVDLQFKDTPIETVLDLYGELTGKSILMAPNVAQLQITFKSRKPLQREEAVIAIETLLTLNGLLAVPFRKDFVRIARIEEGVRLVPLGGLK